MYISPGEYGKLSKSCSPSSPVLTDCLKAFAGGGLICSLAQALEIFFSRQGVEAEDGRIITMLIVIGITAVLTAVGIFDNIAKHIGAGATVPISGFANSIVSAALEFHAEGTVTGTAAQMFSIAGPVIVFGCSTASLYGLIIYFTGLY